MDAVVNVDDEQFIELTLITLGLLDVEQGRSSDMCFFPADEVTTVSRTEDGIVTMETTLKTRKEMVTDEHISTWESKAEGGEVKEHYIAFEGNQFNSLIKMLI